MIPGLMKGQDTNYMSQKHRTYVMGSWEIPSNPKLSAEHYLHYLPRTLKMLMESRLVLMTGARMTAKFVKGNCDAYGMELQAELRRFDNLAQQN